VYDHDDGLLDNSDDFLGRAIIEPEDCAIITQDMLEQHDNDELKVPVEPRWHPFHFAPGEAKCGEVLVAFSVVEHDYNFMLKPDNVDLHTRVDTREFDCNLLILGLRQLQSPGILPVKKAFIKFNCKSLVPPGTASVKDVLTQPATPGPNPTINTTMHFTLPLPTDPLYCPKLTCTVYDFIFRGWNQPIIGVFTLPIGDIMKALREERTEETAAMQDLLKKLKEMVAKPQQKIPSYGGKGETK